MTEALLIIVTVLIYFKLKHEVLEFIEIVNKQKELKLYSIGNKKVTLSTRKDLKY